MEWRNLLSSQRQTSQNVFHAYLHLSIRTLSGLGLDCVCVCLYMLCVWVCACACVYIYVCACVRAYVRSIQSTSTLSPCEVRHELAVDAHGTHEFFHCGRHSLHQNVPDSLRKYYKARDDPLSRTAIGYQRFNTLNTPHGNDKKSHKTMKTHSASHCQCETLW